MRFVRRGLYAHPVTGLSTGYVQVPIKVAVSTYHTSSLNPCFKNIWKMLFLHAQILQVNMSE